MARLGFLLAIIVGVLFALVGSASAATATLSIDPDSTTIDQNQDLTLKVKLNADVDTSAAQTDIEFNAELLQVQDVVAGSSFQGASFLVGVAPQTKAEAIASANVTGRLENVAAFFLPGAGSIPAGDAEFLVLTMRSRSVGGTTEVKLTSREVNDAGGTGIPGVTADDGEVTVTGATASPTPVGQTPTPTASPGPTPFPTPTPTPAPPLDGRLWVQPPSLAIRPGVEFSIDIMQGANRDIQGAQTSIRFDPNLLQIDSVAPGPQYFEGRERALLVMGEVLPDGTQITARKAIDEANTTGLLKNVAAAWIPPRKVPAGETIFLIVKMTSKTTSGHVGYRPREGRDDRHRGRGCRRGRYQRADRSQPERPGVCWPHPAEGR